MAAQYLSVQLRCRVALCQPSSLHTDLLSQLLVSVLFPRCTQQPSSRY